MKNIILSFILVFPFLTNNAFCQYGNLNINLRFDSVYNQLYGPIYNVNSSSNDISAQGYYTWNVAGLYNQLGSSLDVENILGSSRSGSLDALLVMYEATCNKKYLWEFMEQTTQIINSRADKVSPQQSTSPYWFREQQPWHGRIIAPMAKFVYIIRSQNLSNTTIPTSHKSNFANKSNFGEFSDWVNTNIIQTFDFLMTRHWRQNDECMGKIDDGNPADAVPNISRTLTDGTNSKSIMELNFQAPFGCALIYLYLANGDQRIDYAVKAVEMARAYLTTRNGILTYVSGYNAYNWYHNGWQLKRNNQFTSWYFINEFQEDIGHGGFDIMFPLLYNQFYHRLTPHVTGGQYFEDYQMVRFKNTFSNIIYNYSYNIPQSYINQNTFDCSVFGGYNGTYGNFPPSSYQTNAKTWTNLYKFDNTAGSVGSNVYDIMMNFYINVEKFYPINDANYGGLNIVGLANMAAANFKMENINSGCYCKLAQKDSEFNTTISPNPIQSSFSISQNSISQNQNQDDIDYIEIYNLEGKLYITEKNYNEIDVSSLQNGVYIVKIFSTSGDLDTKKIMISK